MTQDVTAYLKNYNAIGDFAVMGTCIMFLILIQLSYIKKERNFYVFEVIIFNILMASFTRPQYYRCIKLITEENSPIPISLVYIMYFSFYFFLFTVLMLFMVYIVDPLHIEKKTASKLLYIPSALYLLILAHCLYEIIGPGSYGFKVYQNNVGIWVIKESKLPYFLSCALFVAMFMWVLFYYRKRMFKQIIAGIIISCSLSVVYIMEQFVNYSTSYTMVAFLFPLYTLFYMVHSNPYDINIGTVDIKAFYGFIEECRKYKHSLAIVEIYLPAFEKMEKKYPSNFRHTIRRLFNGYFNNILMFQTSPGYMMLVADLNKNGITDEKESMEKIDSFLNEILIYMDDKNVHYKAIALVTDRIYINSNDYISLFRFIGSRIPDNTTYIISEEEEEEFQCHKVILSELEDISNKADLDDERINVYCQPVYNIETKSYDTAEALIRLKGIDEDILTPDKFISMAEKYGYIHHLGYVMLNRVCKSIKSYLEQGYDIERISVNFTVADFKSNTFCEDILKIINDNEVSPHYIAIEITETQDETDFHILKTKMNTLKEAGIKFYLDDFGTGYSNYERIIELPFDIIKFDRSLVMACSFNDKSELMVKNLSELFSNMSFSVLFEGVETNKDINRCIDMNGDYLQGYYYSEPIPIENLGKFLTKKAG